MPKLDFQTMSLSIPTVPPKNSLQFAVKFSLTAFAYRKLGDNKAIVQRRFVPIFTLFRSRKLWANSKPLNMREASEISILTFIRPVSSLLPSVAGQRPFYIYINFLSPPCTINHAKIRE